MDWPALVDDARGVLARTLFELNQTPVTALSLLWLVVALALTVAIARVLARVLVRRLLTRSDIDPVCATPFVAPPNTSSSPSAW